MKDPKDFTLVGLVLRMVALKLQEQVIKARRKCLRAELMSRLPEDVPQMIAGWRVRRHWCNETFRSRPGRGGAVDDLDPEARVRQERIIAVSRPVIILVHPGSLGGSFISANEFHPGWKAYAIEQRAILLTEFQYHAGRRIVVRGGMVDDEADQVPEIREAVACADERRRAAPEPAAPRNAAMLMLQRHPATHEFLVTGAWADPGDGCAWEIYRVLRDLAPEGTRVKLSQYAAKADVPEARITSGCTPLLGNTTTRVRWHVLHDSAAYGKNKESMRSLVGTRCAVERAGPAPSADRRGRRVRMPRGGHGLDP